MTTGNLKEKDDALSGPMPNMRVIIDNQVYQKIQYWVNKATGEVSGLGKGVWTANGAFKVTSAILLKQENTGTSTDLDPADVSKAMFELREEPGHLNFWWHSHVDMGVFWSGTDTDTIRSIGRNGFVVATVFNKKREMLSAFYTQSTDMLPEVFLAEIPTQVLQFLDRDQTAMWDKEYDEKCKTKTYPQYNWRERHYGGDDWEGYGGAASDFRHQVWDKETGRWVRPTPPITASKYNPSDTVAAEIKAISDRIGISEGEKDNLKEECLRPELDEICADMIQESDYNKARGHLNRLCAIINRASFFFDSNAKELKAEYIEYFNMQFAAKGKKVKPPTTPPKALTTQEK